MKLTLPYPPTLNHSHYHVPGGARVLKPAARKFYEDVRLLAAAAGAEVVQGEYVMTLHVYRPQTNADPSNVVKLLEDSLQGILIENDKFCKELHLYRYEAEKPKRQNARVIVEVRAA